MNIIFIGASGSGKGTQAKIIAKKLNLCHISSGDLLREYREKGTEAGRIAREYMEAGKWVPIEIVVRLIKDKIADVQKESKGVQGFILDGFPRNIEQAKVLDIKIDYVVNFNNDLSGLAKRLTERRTCKDCGAIFNIKQLKDGKCPLCNGEVYQRTDDNEETIKARFNSFLTETKPVVDYYRPMGIVVDIDADKSIEEVTKQIERVIK